MSAGLDTLGAGAGAVDGQSPHTEDEVYVVLVGSSSFTSSGETIEVKAGDTLFVPAHEEHRFHDITEELRLIVVFAPPEDTSSTLEARRWPADRSPAPIGAMTLAIAWRR